MKLVYACLSAGRSDKGYFSEKKCSSVLSCSTLNSSLVFCDTDRHYLKKSFGVFSFVRCL